MISSEEKEALRFAKYTRLGIWVALVSVFSIGLIEVFKRIPYLQIRLAWSVGALVAVGIVLLLVRLSRYQLKPSPEEILKFHRDPHYWGAVLVAISGIVYALCPPYREPAPEPVVVAIVQPAPVIPEPPIEFPSLQVSAVVVNGAQSSATVNGRVVWLGEDIQGVRLVDVTEERVVVELKGQRKEVACFSPVVGNGR